MWGYEVGYVSLCSVSCLLCPCDFFFHKKNSSQTTMPHPTIANAPPHPKMGHFLFTSESVNEGHPDKICDMVSDSILDACLEQDPNSKVACEACTKTNLVMIFGEISTKAVLDYSQVVRECCKSIGYDSEDKGLDYKAMSVLETLERQSPEIAQAVHIGKKLEDIGAGDQGHMFGYATDETPELMPLTHSLATRLGKRLTEVRKEGILPYLRPDGKTQVTIEYRNHNGKGISVGHLEPVRVHTVLISTQHTPEVSNETIRADVKREVIDKVIDKSLMDDQTIFHLNPSGAFCVGGPHGDAGLTGRKIIVDSYGGWGAHGGGAFSGKDSTKVDRSAAYAARWAAKSLVAAGFARRVLVQVSYSIGIAQPLSMYVDSYGTAIDGYTDTDLLDIVQRNFDFRPGCIVRDLDLKRPIFVKTAAYGHFGRSEPEFTWEKPKDLSHEKK
eukprot:GHVN01102845.1.p1 GENE.GHVN01102845.1~~GHVN01102845.1.p1  ORF type:complete len:443 (+),score=73.24 GHVN01102845.1:183-1511(+)